MSPQAVVNLPLPNFTTSCLDPSSRTNSHLGCILILRIVDMFLRILIPKALPECFRVKTPPANRTYTSCSAYAHQPKPVLPPAWPKASDTSPLPPCTDCARSSPAPRSASPLSLLGTATAAHHRC